MSVPGAPGPDGIEEITRLIRDVGTRAESARRYRALAARVADPAFDRALELGTTLRQALRQGAPDPEALAAATMELRALLAACERAVDELRAGPEYVRAAEAYAAAEHAEVARLACELFTDVAAFPDAHTLFRPIPIAGPRGGPHFVPPPECAARIAAVAQAGLRAATPPPAMGADDVLGAVVLADEHDVGESPITLAIDAGRLPLPVCRIAPAGDVLLYAASVRPPFRVQTADVVADEWWSVRPDAYRRYLGELAEALDALGLGIETER